MKNKTKLSFDLLEQEMEVFGSDEQKGILGGTDGITYQQLIDTLRSGNFSQLPEGSYIMGDNGELTLWGGVLNEVVITRQSSTSNWGFTDSETDSYGYFGQIGGDHNNDYNYDGGYMTGGYYNPFGYTYYNPVPPLTEHGSITTPSPLEAAIMSKAVYGDDVNIADLNGWTISAAVSGVDGLVLNDPSSGFKSQLYERARIDGSKEYCYVTAGTEDFRDFATDVVQIFGIAKQYNQSMENAVILSNLLGGALSFAGHSLGGAEAEANAIMTGNSAVTFNAAGLSLFTTGFSTNSHTEAYIMTNDPLNIFQELTGLPSAGGDVHYLTPTSDTGTWDGHSIDTVIEALTPP